MEAVWRAERRRGGGYNEISCVEQIQIKDRPNNNSMKVNLKKNMITGRGTHKRKAGLMNMLYERHFWLLSYPVRHSEINVLKLTEVKCSFEGRKRISRKVENKLRQVDNCSTV